MDLMPKGYKKRINPIDGSAVGNGFSSGGFGSVKAGSPSISAGIFVIVFSLVVLSGLAYGGLKIYDFKLGKDIQASKKEYNDIVNRQDSVLLKRIVSESQSSAILSNLLKSHIYASKLIDVLAATTLSQVQWNSLSLAADKNKLTLSGRAASYKILAQQIIAFQNSSDWTKIDISHISLDKIGSVAFSADINFNPSLLINNKQ